MKIKPDSEDKWQVNVVLSLRVKFDDKDKPQLGSAYVN